MQDILKQKEDQKRRDLENQVLEALLKITEGEIPEGLINQEVERLLNEIRSRTSTSGLSFEDYLKNIKKTEEEFKNDLRPQAEKTVKIGLALGEVVKLEKIDHKDKDAAKLAIDKLVEYSVK